MRWKVAVKKTKEISEEFGNLPEIVKQILFSRGFKSKVEVDRFFNTDFSSINSPELLPNIDKAVDRILLAISKQEQIFIYGDYDVDGVSATSILFEFLYRSLGAKVLPYIPSRFTEGYGMSEFGLEHLLDEGAKLVITVDCGIRDIALVNDFAAKGLDFIITDHHTLLKDDTGREIYPEKAVAVVHPSLPHSLYPFKEICGTAVAWKLACALSKRALTVGLIDKEISTEFLDLVALATVCDLMPLVDENRILVKHGLRRMSQKPNAGLKAILELAQVDLDDLETYHLGYVIGPRINAGGRIEHALDGVRLLSSTSVVKIREIAAKLENLNKERQQITQDLLLRAEEQLATEKQSHNLLFVYGDDWAEGVVGLVAGRLSERYHKPVLAASVSAGQVKGSARSIRSFNITEAIGMSESILIRFGGHHQAAGFTLDIANLDEFKQNMQRFANEVITGQDLEREISVDAEIEVAQINDELIAQLERFQPFGYGNREPNFLLKGLKVLSIKTIGRENTHLKLIVEKDGIKFDALGFGMVSRYPKLSEYANIDVVCNLSVNKWQGKQTIQFKLIDLKPANESR